MIIRFMSMTCCGIFIAFGTDIHTAPVTVAIIIAGIMTAEMAYVFLIDLLFFTLT